MTYTTYAEYLETPEFRRVKAIVRRRSGGTCEDCGKRKATEPHHVRYCKWGEFDTADNLVDLCHACHCERHRCNRCGSVALKAAEIKVNEKTCRTCRGVSSR